MLSVLGISWITVRWSIRRPPASEMTYALAGQLRLVHTPMSPAGRNIGWQAALSDRASLGQRVRRLILRSDQYKSVNVGADYDTKEQDSDR